MKKLVLIAALFLQNAFSFAQGVYVGSGSVTQGIGQTTATNLFPGCTGSRVSAMGTITSQDGLNWVVPGENNFVSGPYLNDLYNQCSGVMPSGMGAVNLNSIIPTTIDVGGDTVTAYLLGDNYFELYINDSLVGVDPVPYTPFNSCVTKFIVNRPYTIALKLIDWEENLGLGTENNNGNLYHSGDGGFIAVFSDGTITDSSWKAQTFYISPIDNLNNIVELADSTRSSANAMLSPSCNANCFGIHYAIPTNWKSPSFNDNHWPAAHIFSPATVGVNWPAYTNFQSLWSTSNFIWTSNLVLDNVVLVRKTVGALSSIGENNLPSPINKIVYHDGAISISTLQELKNVSFEIYSSNGEQVLSIKNIELNSFTNNNIKLNAPLESGVYIVRLNNSTFHTSQKIIIQQP